MFHSSDQNQQTIGKTKRVATFCLERRGILPVLCGILRAVVVTQFLIRTIVDNR